MRNEFAQARKDAGRVHNFMRSLLSAVEVFDQVGDAEAELTRLEVKTAASKVKAEDALSDAVTAEAGSQQRVEAAEASRIASEASLSTFQQEVAGKRLALEEETERDRLEFISRKAEIASEREEAEGRHETLMADFARDEKAAQDSVTRATERRRDMIHELGGEEAG